MKIEKKKWISLILLLFIFSSCYGVSTKNNGTEYLHKKCKKTISATTSGSFTWSASSGVSIVNPRSGSCEIEAGDNIETATLVAKDSFGNECEKWTIKVFEFRFKDNTDEFNNIHDGASLNIDIQAYPQDVPSGEKSKISNVRLEIYNQNLKKENLTNNPSGKAMSIVKNGSDLQWKIDNARWYWLNPNLCQGYVGYNITGKYDYSGTTNIDIVCKNGNTELELFIDLLQDWIDENNNSKAFCRVNSWIGGSLSPIRDSSEKVLYKIKDIDESRLSRIIDTTVEYGSLPLSSQYRQMTVDEEDAHNDQIKNSISSVINPNNFLVFNEYLIRMRSIAVGRTFTTYEEALNFLANKHVETCYNIYVEDYNKYVCEIEVEAKIRVGSSHIASMKCAHSECP